MEKNYVVINGVKYVLTELPFNDSPHCPFCAFYDYCKQMIEYPFCEVFGFVDNNVNFIFVEAL